MKRRSADFVLAFVTMLVVAIPIFPLFAGWGLDRMWAACAGAVLAAGAWVVAGYLIERAREGAGSDDDEVGYPWMQAAILGALAAFTFVFGLVRTVAHLGKGLNLSGGASVGLFFGLLALTGFVVHLRFRIRLYRIAKAAGGKATSPFWDPEVTASNGVRLLYNRIIFVFEDVWQAPVPPDRRASDASIEIHLTMDGIRSPRLEAAAAAAGLKELFIHSEDMELKFAKKTTPGNAAFRAALSAELADLVRATDFRFSLMGGHLSCKNRMIEAADTERVIGVLSGHRVHTS
ncbi:hypothetical protein [Actinomadura rupiterrae]|uniref:hypothetical protein n=1 Tax=Actinomadura rupiterrae TaxID=559627 RepID=UPI0020A5CB80|nr:hypothetical protein [Actinomadura rupiterrae]MCP2342494.1 hypothetical protein [Actinomadura rupiterrae]